jgi:AraC family transcriptional regulator, regulatory protein of adaptative response / methylated-DNA-[protein]-cysteine methyltransferase
MRQEPTIDDPRWQAVVSRDATADDTFVYAVRTTGIYCRPSCASRPALRANVAFFATTKDAQVAGFRPCKRCLPDNAKAHLHQDAITRACILLRDNDEPPDLAELSNMIGLSPGRFQRVFKKATGLSPKQYAIAARKHRLRQELSAGGRVTDAIYAAGYAASSRAYSDAQGLGMSPVSYSKGAPGETIRFAIAPTTLGPLLVATSAKGVCFAEFGERDQAEAALRQRFPAASIICADAALAETVAQVVAHIDAPALATALPIDIRGTAFQELVWRALTLIPLGETTSYAALAGKIGRPTAARAVARACATNTIAVVIPCHRVVRGSGDLSGYKWGIERKRDLLGREKAAAAASNPMSLKD